MVCDTHEQATQQKSGGCRVKRAENRHLPSFMDAEERRPYAQTLSDPSNKLRFSLPKRAPTISNRDMGELMYRDLAFGKGAAHDSGMSNVLPSQEDVDLIKPLVIAPEHGHAALTPRPLYIPLPSNDHFRLLEILPGADDARLQCRLHICSMRDNRGTYKASLGTNLFLALHRLRRKGSSRIVWADALCIDQSNDRERSQQVAAMGGIFRNAHTVLVWLGADDDAIEVHDVAARTSAKAFAGVCSVVETWAAAIEPEVLSKRPQYKVQGLGEQIGNGLLSAESTVWLDILQLYKRRWFSRLWVVQEIALAARATAIWGACEMSWEWIELAAAIIRTNWDRFVPGWVTKGGAGYFKPSLYESRRVVPVGVMNAYFMYRISRLQRYFDPLRFSFCELLTLTRQFQCQDDRDKIYGLLGLPTTDNVNSCITPDYTQPLAEVYRSVASAMLNSPRPLDFLSHVYRKDTYGTNRTLQLYDVNSHAHGPGPDPLPSWIPQWHLVGPQTLTPLNPHPDFAADLAKRAQFRGADVESGNPDRLAVLGVLLEEVSATKTVESPRYLGRYRTGDVGSVLAQYGHTRHSLEKLTMTLAAGKSWYGTPKDRVGMLADFADCLVGGQLWWALEPHAFGRESDYQLGNQRSPNGDSIGSSSANGTKVITMQNLEEMSMGGNGNLFLDVVGTACVGRRLFTTVSGMQGIGPWDTKPGDKLCVIYGCAMPFVIRRMDEEGQRGYMLVGECYVDDIMHGEAVDNEKYEETWIQLV